MKLKKDKNFCETLNHSKIILSLTGFWPDENLIISNLKGCFIGFSLAIFTIFHLTMLIKNSSNITMLVE